MAHPMAVEATKLGALIFGKNLPSGKNFCPSLNHALESRELRSAFQDIKKKTQKKDTS
jgi:hypothetical protein